MKVLISYGENANDLLNYTELNNMKTQCDNMPDVNLKMIYLDIDNAKNGNPNAYIEVSMESALSTSSWHDMRTKNLITINDSVARFYFVGSIIRVAYENDTTARIEFQILPIQTSVINGVNRYYDCLMTKTPNKPTYTNNIAQNIVGETITSVNYGNAIQGALANYQSGPVIMLVVNKDLSPVGLINRGFNQVLPAGEQILDNPLPCCATRVGGAVVPGFVLVFDSQAALAAFIDSCYNAKMVVRNERFLENGTDYKAAKATANFITDVANWAKKQDLILNNDGNEIEVVNADNITSVFVPEIISPGDFIMCKEIPIELYTEEEPLITQVNLPITVNTEPYFNLSSILQVKAISSSGQSITLDGNNILFNDGNPATGFNCKMVVTLSGIDLFIGESAYTINLCKFPDISYSGNSFENYNTTLSRSGTIAKSTNAVKTFFSNIADSAINVFQKGNFEGENAKSYDNTPLDKTSVVGAINASAWRLASLHVETTYLPAPVKARLNAVYDRWGYDDFRSVAINLLAIDSGYWQAAQIQEVNIGGLTDNTVINSAISDGVKSQLIGGIYVKA